MTHEDANRTATLEGLSHLLDTFGADRSRWPARERLQYSSFIAEHAGARRLVAEAEALDELLDRAPEPAAGDLGALADRIILAASSEPQVAGNVVALRPHRVPSRAQSPPRAINWPAAALLAASLVLGVFAGQAGLVDEPMRSIAALTASADGGEDEAASFSLLGDEEDIL